MTARIDDNEHFYCGLPDIIKIDGTDPKVLSITQRIFTKMKGSMESIFDDYPLTHKDFFILKCINEVEQSGKLISSGEISRLFDISRSAASQFTSSLENRGYIQREVSSKDKRKTYFKLKPKSIAIIQQIDKTIFDSFFELQKRMGKDKFNEMISLASTAVDIIEAITQEKNSNK